MEKARLDSWKAIADYLKRSIRTVQRWHIQQGLPVYHFPGPKGAAFAYRDEIDSWFSICSGKDRIGYFGQNRTAHSKTRSLELTDIADRMWEIRSERNLHSIAGFYREAIDEDSANAAAYAGMAKVMIFMALFGMVESSMAYSMAMEALRRQSPLAPDSTDRRCSEAWLDFAWARKWGRARAVFEEALADGPHSSFALSGLSLLHIAEGNLSEAMDQAWKAWELNTLASTSSTDLCWIPYLAGDYERALQTASDLRMTGGFGATHAAIEALALIQTGAIAQHLKRLEDFVCDYPHDGTLQGVLGYFYATSNQSERAWEMLGRLGWTSSGSGSKKAYASALVLIGLDKPKEAVQSLETSYTAGSRWSLGFRSDPILKALSGDLKFLDLVKRAGPSLERNAAETAQRL